LAFDAAGNLFVNDGLDGKVIEITPNGTKITFASGLSNPFGLAFDSAGNLFVSNNGNDQIIKITPGGVKSTFVTGLSSPSGLAFNSAGDLLEADFGTGNIYESTPNGVRTTFAIRVYGIYNMAFDRAGNLFAATGGNITEIEPDGTQRVFNSSFQTYGLAFQGVSLPVPEPSALGLLAVGAAAFLVRRRRWHP
jgi:sugar lactone lactonase YvrE